QLARRPVPPLRKARVVAPTVGGEAADCGDRRLVDDHATAPSVALEAEARAERSAGCPRLDEAVGMRVSLPREGPSRMRAFQRSVERQDAAPVDPGVLLQLRAGRFVERRTPVVAPD